MSRPARKRARARVITWIGSDRIALSRVLLALVVIAAGAWLVVATAWATSLRGIAPERALTLAPWDSIANARVAERALVPQGKGTSIRPAQIARAEEAARRALAQSPTNAVAWRTLGYVAALREREQSALALFRTAQRFSRRDSPTQIWLIEHSVQKGEIGTALDHYDVALRTSPGTRALLLPILVQASNDPAIRKPLGQVLARHPPWTTEFVYALVSAPPKAEAAATILAAIRRGGPLPGAEAVTRFVAQLASSGEERAAERVYRLLQDPVPPSRLLRNGDFSSDNDVPPLDWTLVQSGGLESFGEGGRLQLRGSVDTGGTVASQVLVLPQGSYRFRARVGRADGAPAADLALAIGCAGTPRRELLRLAPLLQRDPVQTVDGRFDVPAECRSQALSIDLLPVSDPAGAAAWIDDVSLEPIR